MKKTGIILLLALLFSVLCISTAAAEETGSVPAAGETAEEAEWTVMFYMCGSDLESKYSYATGNLEEISKCQLPFSNPTRMWTLDGSEVTKDMIPRTGKVNVIIETGGCKAWHAQRLGLDISSRKLQRWSFSPIQEEGNGGYRLEEELPPASMADPETLQDFITWSAEKYPAKKYALVLWDHGGGSKTGIFIDELYGNDTMYLYELGMALRGGGVMFETVLFDACLMANVETAYIIRDYAKYMVASEEVVAGQGTAIGDWLQELYYTPSTDGRRLGRLICDMTQIKCADIEDTQASEMLTWSVIDLSKIERLGQCLDRFYYILGKAYTDYPDLMRIFMFQMINNERYGNKSDSMSDLGSMFYKSEQYQLSDVSLRQDMLEALEDAVIYTVRGSDHFGARGLSFCYAPLLSPDELDIYCKNCPSPNYLALIDAISPWTAPDWVYDRAERLPEIDELEAYDIVMERKIAEDGIPGVNMADGTRNVILIQYKWYQKLEESGELVDLGKILAAEAETEDGEFLYAAYQLWKWPSIEGVPCCFNVVSFYPGGTSLCEIPIKVGADVWKMRIGYEGGSSVDVYGVWDGSEYMGQQFTRTMKSLAQMVGQNYQLLYPVADTEEIYFKVGKEAPFLRSLKVTATTLPAGTYYLEYIIMDMFQRNIPMERIELYWDGEKLTMAEGTEWDGTVRLVWDGRTI